MEAKWSELVDGEAEAPNSAFGILHSPLKKERNNMGDV